MNRLIQCLCIVGFLFSNAHERAVAQSSARKLGVDIGIMSPGEKNAITDVQGVAVGHTTLVKGGDIRTGVTAIIPHPGNVFQQKVPAAIFVGNGFGKLAGSTQVEELGNLETPIILTNTLSVATGISALIDYTLSQEGNESVQSVNALVGETNDGYLNDIRGRHVSTQDVFQALNQASSKKAMSGQVQGPFALDSKVVLVHHLENYHKAWGGIR